MHRLLQDVRFSLRLFLKQPGFTLTAILSLALGIGATTAVFSVIYAALIDPYPFRDAHRIMRLSVRDKAGEVQTINLNPDQVRLLQQSPVVESVIAMDYHAMTLREGGIPENVNAIGLIAAGYDDLGVPPLLGRGLQWSDAIDGKDPEPVVFVSHKFWLDRLGGDPNIVGKTLRLDRKSFTVVGVAAPRFRWYVADVYLPLKMDHDPQHFLLVNFRLKPGLSPQQADAALQPLIAQFAKENPKRFPEQFQVRTEDLNAWVNRQIGGTLYLLFGAVGLLLAIGCGNVSILLMAQGTARQHEIAMRAALGASGGDIVRHLITESMLLAAIGLPAGVLASHGILAAIQMVLPPYAFAPEVVIRIHLPVLAFSALLSLLTAVVFGLWPALQLSWTEAGRAVATASRRVAGSIRGRRTHGALICAQIALTLVLVATAGASGQAFVQLMQTPLGYDPHNVMSVGIPIRENSYTTWEARTAYFDQLRAKVAETPGVTMTAISSNGTPPRSGWMTPFEILGAPAVEQQKASANFVSSEYFEMLRIPMVEGRIWSKGEERQGTHVAVVNQTFARRYFPNGGATGRSIKMPQMDDGQALTAGNVKDSWLQVIGVVSDARNDGLSKPVAPGVYVPYTLVLWRGTQVLVKAETSPLSLLRAVRMQLTTVDPEQQSHSGSEDLETWIRNQMEWRQGYLVMSIFAGFGILGLALAAVGLYSVVSYTVVQRTNEFAVRMALGAAPGHVLRIVLSSTVGSVGAGVFIGLLLTRGLSALLAQWARGNSGDPWILLAGAMVLSMVAAAASALPAWRASRVDPMTALRCE